VNIEETNLLESQGKTGIDWKNWRAILAGCLGIVFAMTIMVVSFGAVISPTYSAEEAVKPVTATTSAVQKTEYYLPYPGILPDSPLYKIKAIRDRIKLWLTINESEKAKVELALADKRINAALALLEGNKPELAITTATKAEKYLELSTNRVLKLIKSGVDEKSQLLNLEKAIAKHYEILLTIKEGIGSMDKEAVDGVITLNRLMAERVGQLKLEVIK